MPDNPDSTEPFEDRVGNDDREDQVAINDSVAGETVWSDSGDDDDNEDDENDEDAVDESAAQGAPDYAPNDLARQQIDLDDEESPHHGSLPTTQPGEYASYDAMTDDDDDESFDISLTDGPDLNAGDNIDTGAGLPRHRSD